MTTFSDILIAERVQEKRQRAKIARLEAACQRETLIEIGHILNRIRLDAEYGEPLSWSEQDEGIFWTFMRTCVPKEDFKSIIN